MEGPLEGKTRKYRVSVGVFMSVTFLLLLGVAAYYLRGRLFKSGREYALQFSESVGGLKPGAGVFLWGVPVGEVRSVELKPCAVCPSAHPYVVVKIWDESEPMLPPERVAISELSGLLTGEERIQIRAKQIGDTTTRPHVRPTADAPQQIIETIPSLSTEAREKLVGLLAEFPRTIERVGAAADEVSGLAVRLDGILKDSDGKLDRLLTEATLEEVRASLRKLGDAADSVKSVGDQIAGRERQGEVVQNLNDAVKELKGAAAELGPRLDKIQADIRGLTQEGERLSRENRARLAELLQSMEGTNLQLKRTLSQLQRNPLLGGP
jgi:ABC-type transporter Mla subunit MlaD